jgi:chaperonin GroES
VSAAWTPTPAFAITPTRKSSTALQEAAITLDGKEIRGPITAVENSIICRVKDTLTATSGGILLPDQAKERPTEGLVIEAGPGRIHPFTAVRITNPIKVGMSVLYGKFDGRQVEYKGEECQVVRDDDILLYYTGVSMKLDTVIPCRDYVLVKLDEKMSEESMQTKSGVVIAAQVMKDNRPCEGIVAKVGEGRMASEGNFTPSPVQPGEKVKWKDYAGNEVMIEGKPYSVVKMVNILCSLRTDNNKE